MTVLIGTGGPKQTVIGAAPSIDGGRISSRHDDSRGGSKQTVYSREGGLTVLIGTGGPHQTVHQLPPGSGYPYLPEGSHRCK